MDASYYQKPIGQILELLKTRETGLSAEEVSKRLETYGLNEIKEERGAKWYRILFSQFLNVMVAILVVAMIISFAIGERLDAAAIGVIIMLNAIIGFIQEYKAEKAIEALRMSTPQETTVMRGGKILQLKTREIVPGDILVLEEGMQIPADARLMSIAELSTSEASLTGESNPIQKTLNAITASKSIGDLHNMVFLGTLVTKGRGRAVAVQTGMKTEFGKIAHAIQSEQKSTTPLQKSLNRLTKILAITVVAIAVALFIISLFTGRDLLEMILLNIGLAVSIIPEGLPAVITLALAVGAQHMAKKMAIVRKLTAAETLGSVSVICSDKTGTLTQNQMTVGVIYVDEKIFTITGAGYKPEGNFLDAGKAIEPLQSKELELLLINAGLCNNAQLMEKNGTWSILGDPTEASLLTLAHKANLNFENLQQQFPRTDELVFDSNRKRMSTVNGMYLFTKGAADSILEVCTHIQIHGSTVLLTDSERERIKKSDNAFAQDAYRVLGFAYKIIEMGEKPKEEKLIFLGLVGMIDPPRPEVQEAIVTCSKAHVNVVMITGDHPLTAQAIAKKIGIFREGEKILTGGELDTINDDSFSAVVEDIRIYARVSPHHKVRILKALKAKGHIVAMTGDGVNDAPALKSSDIGVAMGITGTDVAKEASDIILADDNFATIVLAIENGRTIYQNIKKCIRFLLSANFDELLVIVVIFTLGGPIPFIPLQILWINLLTDALPAVALGIDVPDEHIMTVPPRDPKESIVKRLLGFSLVASIVSAVATLVVYFTVLDDSSVAYMRTMVFTMIVVFELFLVFSARYGHQSFFKNFFKNKFLLVGVVISFILQLFAIYHPWFQKILETVPLSLNDWALIIGRTFVGIFIIELWKRFRSKRRQQLQELKNVQ